MVESKDNKVVKKWYHVDKSMITTKLFSFCNGFKISIFEPYFILFLLSINLEPVKAGLIGGLRLIGFIVGGFFWGILADYTKSYKTILIITTLGSSLCTCLQPFVTIWLSKQNFDKKCKFSFDNNEFHNLTTSQRANTTTTKPGQISDENAEHLFYAMLSINILMKFFESFHFGFIDSATIEKCRLSKPEARYGFQRMDHIGSVIGSFVINELIERLPNLKVPCYSVIFFTYSIVNLIYAAFGISVSWNLKFNAAPETTADKVIHTSYKKHIKFSSFFFVFIVFIMGILNAVFLSFTIVLIQDLRGAIIINTLVQVIAMLAIIPAFTMGEYFIKKLHGTWSCIALCCFSYFVRYLISSLVENVWILPALQIFNGLGFGLFYIASTFHIKETFDPNIRTSMYSVFHTFYFGIGAIVGNVVAGKLYKDYNGKTLFGICSGLAGISSLIIFVYIVSLKCRSKTKKIDNCVKLTEVSAKKV